MLRKIASAVLAVALLWAGTAFADMMDEMRQAHVERVAWCAPVWSFLPPDQQSALREKGVVTQWMPWGEQGDNVPFLIETDHPVRFTEWVQTGWIDFSVQQVYGYDLAAGRYQYTMHRHILAAPPCLIVLVDDSGLEGEARGKMGFYDNVTGTVFLNVDQHQGHEDMMVTLFHEFIHHYLNRAALPSSIHHGIMCKKVDNIDRVSTTGFRDQVCDPDIGW